jgi:hypothetical protein
MKKAILFLSSILLCACSAVEFDHPMPFQGNKIENVQELSGTYSFTDTTIHTNNEIYYNAEFYKDEYKKRDSIKLISAIIYFENKLVGYKIHTKIYYNINKVDTMRVLAFHNTAQKSTQKNYLIFDEDSADTLIDLTKKDQLKFFNGKYYLNKYNKENQWEVYQVALKEDVLDLGIINEQDRNDLSNYTIKRTKTTSLVHLEDDLFSNFVKAGGFKTRIKFKKHGTSH